MKKFLWDTLIGGLFVVVPVSWIGLHVKHLVTAVGTALAPIAEFLPFEAALPGLWAVILILLVSFLTGIIVHTESGKRITHDIDRKISRIFPPWAVIRGAESIMTGKGDETKIKPALFRTDEGTSLVFMVEEVDAGRCAIFLPEAPNPAAGPVMIVDRDRIEILDTGVGRLARCIAQWGLGAKEVMGPRARSSRS